MFKVNALVFAAVAECELPTQLTSLPFLVSNEEPKSEIELC